MRLFGSDPVLGIARDTLDFISEISKEVHPDTFTGHLRAMNAKKAGLDRKGRIITDVLLVPESNTRDTLSILGVDMLPRKSGVVGTVHSDPSGELVPDDDDLSRFAQRGNYHIILAYPYEEDSWRCYDRNGVETELQVLDVDLEDEDDYSSFFG